MPIDTFGVPLTIPRSIGDRRDDIDASSMVDVSVLTPSFGYGRFLEDAVQSVVGQDGVTVQHVIQDGGSQDGTLELLRRYDRSIDWRSEPDEGQSDALNKALARAEGRWVAWLNADEFYLPGGLATLVRHGDRTAADVVYGDNVFVDEQGRVTRLLGQHGFSRAALWGRCCIQSSSAIFRRSALPLEPWDVGLSRIMDWDLYLKMVTLGARVAYVKYPVGAFRRHDAQTTGRPEKDYWHEWATVFERHGITRWSRRRARALHRAFKLGSGGYWRELQAKRFRGQDLRWFDGGAGRTTAQSLLRSCYPAHKSR
jgi:glycosyltransferase involved in cell wall biosynthesis